MLMASIFTKIIDGEIPSYRVYEDDRVVAFLDINPVEPGHTLLVPRTEVPDLFDLDPPDYRALWRAARTVADAIEASTGCERVVVLVFGYDVPHAHVHLIPTTRRTGFPFPQPVPQTAEEMESMAATLSAAVAPAYDEHSALLVVDVQNDFADPEGSLAVPGAEAIIPVVNREIERARAAGATVVYTQDWHPPSTPHFREQGGTWPVHCVRDTPGAEFHPDLIVADDAVFTKKGTGGEDGYSGFSMRDPEDPDERTSTGLDAALRERDITRVVIAGLAADYCVKETGLDAIRLGYDATVLRAGVRAVDLSPGDGERALSALEDAGAVIR
jgi:nicotinamidase/pyrazinamidase